MSLKSSCKISEKHLSRSKREVEIEIPPHAMFKTIQDYNKRDEKDKRKDIELKKISSRIAPDDYQETFEPMIAVVTECFEEFLKDYPEEVIGQPTLRLRVSQDNSIKLVANFNVVVKPIKKIDALKVTKEKFCRANVDKNIHHEITKQRELLAFCTPVKENRCMQVNDSVIIDCEVAYHIENVLETISGLSFDLIEEDHQDQINNGHQKSHKSLRLKATHQTLDKLTLSTLHVHQWLLLNAIEKNEDFFNLKVGETKQRGVKLSELSHFFDDFKHIENLEDINIKGIDNVQNADVITITICVKKIYKKKLPPIDKKLAKKMGFSSVQQMNKNLNKKYIDLENQRIETLLHNDIIREFIKQNPPGFFSKYILRPARKMFFKIKKSSILESNIASKQLVNQKMKSWIRDGYIKEETESLLTEMVTVINLARKWDILETIANEFRHKVSTTPGLYEKLQAELPPEKKGEPQIHPMVYDMIKRTVAQSLLSTAIITEIEPTDRNEGKKEFLPEALKATQSTTLSERKTDALSSP